MVLTDGAIETVLVFEMGCTLDPQLEASVLVETAEGREALKRLYTPYLETARRHNLPLQLGTPTFRCSPDRVAAAGRPGSDVVRLNGENGRFLRELCGDQVVLLAGVIGPRGDAYLPDLAPDAASAAAYHRVQALALAEAGVDRLYAPTFPAVPESVGVAAAMAETGLPFSIGFVLGQDGKLLDGSTLDEAIAAVDQEHAPTHYMLSCVHVSVARKALEKEIYTRMRVRGVKANTSRKPTSELVALGRLDTEEPDVFADELLALARDFNLEVLGGCCGTNGSHIEALARKLVSDPF